MSNDDPNTDWWCWTWNEPSTFRCRDLGHDVRPQRKPAYDAEPTSVRLRQTQRDLAASQADLTRARAELDLVRAELASARKELERLRVACPDKEGTDG
jgi:septal ring factor EnvC (AmiA/AmiB activator)